MVDENDDALESRPPTLNDLVALCRHLNEEGARYVIVGGMAIIQAGFVRATEDIDLLVDPSEENVDPDDIKRYVVVRVADEVVVDLMKTACGIEYEEAAHSRRRQPSMAW